jgi:Zn-dependent peptidase ImmA (M78 family)/transcriptional regulator with XRE-family HTH domain
MNSKEQVGAAVRRARERCGMTQQALADAAGFPNLQTVSDVERGVRDLKARELHRIARAVGTSYDVLLGARPEPAVRVLWRRGTPPAPSAQEARFLERASRFALLEEWSDLPPAEPLPDLPYDPAHTSGSEVEAMAMHVGRTLLLGSRPAAALVRVLEERFRVKVFYDDLAEDGSAACVRDGFGAAVLINASQAPWRRNYSFAHELFHLVTWTAVAESWPAGGEEPAWSDAMERHANRFASHLLLPGEEVAQRYEARLRGGDVAHADYVEMAREFDVSTDALLWRLCNLRYLTADQVDAIRGDAAFRALDRSTMGARWTTPGSGLPDRYHRLAYLAYAKGRISLARLAEFLETSVSELVLIGVSKEHAEEAATPAA